MARLDNMLLDGFALDEQSHHIIVESIRTLNRKLYNDDRVDISMVPVSDGLTLVRKR